MNNPTSLWFKNKRNPENVDTFNAYLRADSQMNHRVNWRGVWVSEMYMSYYMTLPTLVHSSKYPIDPFSGLFWHHPVRARVLPVSLFIYEMSVCLYVFAFRIEPCTFTVHISVFLYYLNVYSSMLIAEGCVMLFLCV